MKSILEIAQNKNLMIKSILMKIKIPIRRKLKLKWYQMIKRKKSKMISNCRKHVNKRMTPQTPIGKYNSYRKLETINWDSLVLIHIFLITQIRRIQAVITIN